MDNTKREARFRVAMMYLREMRGRGIITDAELEAARTELLLKYRPVIGTLTEGKIIEGRSHDSRNG